MRSYISIRLISTNMEMFSLDHSEKAVTDLILGAAVNASHLISQFVTSEEALILVAGKLTAAITVQDLWLSRFSPPQTNDDIDTGNFYHPLNVPPIGY